MDCPRPRVLAMRRLTAMAVSKDVILACRKLMMSVVLISGAGSADAAEPQKWCSTDGATITQTFDQSADGAEASTYLLDGKPISVNVERGNGEEDFAFIVYNDMIFAPCDTAGADAAECDEFFPCP